MDYISNSIHTICGEHVTLIKNCGIRCLRSTQINDLYGEKGLITHNLFGKLPNLEMILNIDTFYELFNEFDSDFV